MEDTHWGTEEDKQILLASVLWVRDGGREKPGRWLSPRLLGPWDMVDGCVLGLSTHRSGRESCSRTVVVNVKSQISQKFWLNL